MQHFLLFLFALGNIVIALWVFLNNPRSWTNRLFTLLTATITVYLLVNTELYLIPNYPLRLFLARSIMAVAALINLFVFLFLTTFPRDRFSLKRWQVLSITVFSIVLFFLGFTNFIFKNIQITEDNLVLPEPGIGLPVFTAHTLFTILGGLVALFLRFRKARGLERVRMRFVLLGFVVLFSLILVLNFMLVVVFQIGNFVPFLPVYILFFNAIIAYAIIKHRLLEIRILVAKTVTFTLLTVVVAALYAGGLFTVARFVPEVNQGVVSIVLAVILVFTFSPLRRLLERMTISIFHKGGYSSEAFLEQLGEMVSSTLSLEILANGVLEQMQHRLQVGKAAFILLSPHDKLLVFKTKNYDAFPSLSSEAVRSLAEKAGSSPLVYEEIEKGAGKDLMRASSFSVVLALRVRNKLFGLLVFGEKLSGDVYTNQDLEVLEIFSPQISVAIQNALAYDEIRRFSVTLKKEVAAATKRLRTANRELRHLDKLKDEFVFIAAHELKNPVTAIRGYLYMLQKQMYGGIPQKLKEPIEQLNTSNQQLVQLVNDLLQIARAEAKTITIKTEPVNLCQIVDETIASLKPLAQQKKLALVHDCQEEQRVMADANRLTEILNNLISNSIKYSDKGTIRVSHSIEKTQVVTHVADQGVGIDKEDQEKIFTRFFRSAEEKVKGIPGTGLGLFIVKQLVDKMKGEIWFTSEKGQGTVFSFSLPKSSRS